MCVFIVLLLFCPHCFSFSLCVCGFFVYSSVIYTRLNFLCLILFFFSINVFPIILVIIIIILSTTFFSIICKWTTFASKDECQRQSCDVSVIFVVGLLGSVHALEAKIFAPNWDANGAASIPRCQLNLSCQTEARPRATGLQDCEVIKFIYFCFFFYFVCFC